METVEFLKELQRMCDSQPCCKCSLKEGEACLARPSYKKYNPQLVYELVTKWSKIHPEFKVGDEVYTGKDCNGNYLDVGIVVSLGFCSDESGISVMSKSGSLFGIHDAKLWHKTGRHFDEFEKILCEIGMQ